MGNDVAVSGGNSNMPAHLQTEVTDSGFIDGAQDLLQPPRIKLIQKTSGEFDEGLAKNGQFFNTATGEAVDEFVFTPIKADYDWIEFDSEGNIVFQTTDKVEAEARYGDKTWKAQRINILMLPYGTKIPAIYSFKGAAFKPGTNLYRLAYVADPTCMFKKAYKLTSEEKTGQGGKYHVPVIGVAKDVEGYSDSHGWLSKDAFDVAKFVAEAL